VGGLSKPLGMGGLRIGWIATHDRRLRDRLDRQLQLLSGGPASLATRAAVVAFACYDESIAGTLAAVQSNAPHVFAALDAARWRYTRPLAGLTVEACPPIPATLAGEERVRQAGMFLVPGTVYRRPGAYRIGLLADVVALRQALSLLAEPFPANE
jgi:aspartate/methionine/tyrosine aminotransferase